MENGWIKLHRRLLDNPIAKKPAWAWLWIVLLMMANHNDKSSFIWNGKKVDNRPGMFVSGRKRLSEATGIPESTIERILDYLENEHQIGQQKTSKYRLITILKWEKYQKADSVSDNKWTTNGQQTDTIKNDKNIKNDKKGSSSEQSSQEKEIPLIIDLFKGVNPSYRKWFANKTQRAAVLRLLDTHSFDKLSKVIALLPKTNKIDYCPIITTPLQLEDKFAHLSAQLVKIKNKEPIIL